MRNQLFAVVFLAIVSVLFGQSQPVVLTLQKCEELAFDHHPDIVDAKMGLEISHVRKDQASHARYLPKIELRNVWGPVPRARIQSTEEGFITSPDTATTLRDLRFFTDVDFNLLQPIYTFGRISNLNRAAAHGVEVDEAKVEQSFNDVRVQVREVYWGVLLGQELMAVVEDARREVDKAETKIREKLDEGSDEVSQKDLYKLQIFKYEINKRSREAEDKLTMARSALRALVGLNDNASFELEADGIEQIGVELDSLEFYLNAAAESRPEVRQLESGLLARRSLINMERSNFYPQFFFGGQIRYNYAYGRDNIRLPFLNDPTNFFRPGFVLGLNMNLNYVQVRDNVRMAQVEYNRLANRQVLLNEGIKIEVRKVWLAAKQAESNLRDSRRALRASDNWLRAEAQVFDLGVGEVKDFIDAYKANGTMQAEHFQNIYAYNTAIARLSQAVGRDLYNLD
jgi:outer membrane protein TolC